MDEIYKRIRARARQIVAQFPLQVFYSDFPNAVDRSARIFNETPIIKEIHNFVANEIGDNLGHGLDHAVKVTLDAGALMAIEGPDAGYSKTYTDRRILLVQSAALLHDIRREESGHAEKGALFANTLLRNYPFFKSDEISDISNAISNHEAFKSARELKTAEGALLSDCLYDADKFRWGPDNFTHTVWDMLMISKIPVATFYQLYPKGIKGLARIKKTFRTTTGKKYGPQFIDTGLAIGAELYQVIADEFSDYI